VWYIVKLLPTITFKDIDRLYSNGWRQYHCCNTLPVKEGGVSGKTIKTYTDKLTNYISETYPNTIVISGGGIHDYSDLCSYKENGASHFSISTLLINPANFIYLLTNL
jgi:dihydroorotate dehydrogenase